MGLESVATEKPQRRRVHAFLAGLALLGSLSTTGAVVPSSPAPAPAVASMELNVANNLLTSRMSAAYKARKTTPVRDTTLYAVFHTTEGNDCSIDGEWLRGARRNKRGRRVWTEPKANILICEDSIYTLTDLDRYANSAGVSMFDGHENISDISVGVEIRGTWRRPISDMQYEFACATATVLKHRFNLTDSAFLSHAQVAYSEQGWLGQRMRGRKRDGINFDWGRMCIKHRTDDPDVEAMRLKADPHLQYVHSLEATNAFDAQGRVDSVYGLPSPLVAGYRFGEIKNSITPWTVAGDAFNERQTVYFLPPAGRRVRGSEIEGCSKNPKCKGVTWYSVPYGTLVFPYVEERHVNKLTKEVRKQYFN